MAEGLLKDTNLASDEAKAAVATSIAADVRDRSDRQAAAVDMTEEMKDAWLKPYSPLANEGSSYSWSWPWLWNRFKTSGPLIKVIILMIIGAGLLVTWLLR